MFFFFYSSRRRHTRLQGDWSSDVCSSDLFVPERSADRGARGEDQVGALLLLLGVIAFRSLAWFGLTTFVPLLEQIGRASCRERVKAVEDTTSGNEKQS